MEKEENNKPNSVIREEKILKFWNENNIFKKSVEKDAPKGDFVFYDGPPFATGKPHYGHLVPGTIKDVIPRYKTMQGYRVIRRWGWDTQGVPIEAIVQEENNLKTKQDIEAFGVKKFTDFARSSIFRYADYWKEIIPKTGRWVDFDDLYITMASNYTESIWWMWKELYKKGLIYEGFKSMHISPPLETALSNFEVNQGYKDVTDLSVTAKFELLDDPNTFVLAWTTTPWTLMGNVALAVGKNISYLKVFSDGSNYIVAKDLLEKVFKGEHSSYEIISEINAEKDLIGKFYKPLFDYYSKDRELKNVENGWKIYDADFVTTEDGTGIVHIAPAFGEDDLNLGNENNLPFVQHVNIDGTIKKEVTDFAGLEVKPKDDPMSTDIIVMKYLADKNLLFDKEKYTHSYPHCYRTDAPLLNYAMSSWFIKVTDLKNKLISENQKVNWVPDSVGQARFGNWLKEAKDWAVSRARYWGTPIPIWKSEDGKETVVIGSLDELRDKVRDNGKLCVIRHGEADHNVSHTLSGSNEVISHLTEVGRSQILKQIDEIKKEKIDIIVSSPLIRTQETAELIAENIGYDKEKIVYDKRIEETQTGIDGRPVEEYRSFFKDLEEKFDKKRNEQTETLTEMKNRVGEFLYDIKNKYRDKSILVVTHEYVAWMMVCVRNGYDKKQSVGIKREKEDFIETGEIQKLDFVPIPHNENYELDFHKPFIDDVVFNQNGKEMKRIPDVFDTWIDSGSVPFASHHYPFEKDKFNPFSSGFLKSKKTINYPADFIAEGLDQTRGWFYSMLVLNTSLFDRAPYKNVVVNGLLLAEDGRKMSKHFKNYPEVEYVLEKYGADALRYFLMASSLVRAEETTFSEKGVDDVMKKLIGRLDNVVNFYEMYGSQTVTENSNSENVLDKWIINRLNEANEEITNSLEKYEIDRAARPIMSFVDDLSTWYIRRSRDRFKIFSFVTPTEVGVQEDQKDKESALITTKYVLINFSKLIAPFVPFVAEDVYQRVTGNQDGSVHLQEWPKIEKVDKDILKEMENLREVVTKVLEIRSTANIKVRQPLQRLTIKNEDLKEKEDLLNILKDEINVKEISFDKNQNEDFVLDTDISEELKAEGEMRELIRKIQDLRKKSKLSPEDEITLEISKSYENLVNKFKEEISKTTKIKDFKFVDGEEEVKISLG
jgi:isoleucyl-tRNA synthetase